MFVNLCTLRLQLERCLVRLGPRPAQIPGLVSPAARMANICRSHILAIRSFDFLLQLADLHDKLSLDAVTTD